jgi:hypothetical protein
MDALRAIRIPILTVLCGASVLIAPGVCVAGDSSTASVRVTAGFASRTSLKVSTELLRFDVGAAGQSIETIVDFSAAARTHQGGEVVLTVELAGALDGPGGASDVEASLTFSGIGNGLAKGPLDHASPSVAGRWIGSGLRTGQLAFTLRSSAPGSYSVPVRFVLSAP